MGATRSADPRRDTIIAIATPPGRGALALVRLSGLTARGLATRIGVPATLVPRRATRVTLHACDAPREAVDDALVTFFPAPHSATGEDLLELSVHGGSYVATTVLAALVAAGARPALAGEFTERAVRHGKMDLLQAEAVADLIDARSRSTHRHAMRQLGGALSRCVHEVRDALLEVEALLAYDIDFPEEDDGPIPRCRATDAADRVLETLHRLGGTLPAAELGRDGITVVLAGAPNAGKSSLFNALLGDVRAIVSDIPGTTRDALEVLVDSDPYPIRYVDTAGLRDSDDRLERLGVEVSGRWLARAQIIVVCGSDRDSLHAAERAVAERSDAPRLRVRTKCDLADLGSATTGDPWHDVAVSAHTGVGLDALRAMVGMVVRRVYPEPAEEQPMITRARHVTAIKYAEEEVRAFRDAWASDALPAPVAVTHLRSAILALDALVGGIDIEEVLERVFRTFCVGK